MAATSLILVGLVGALIPLPLSHFLWTLFWLSFGRVDSLYQVQALNHRTTLCSDSAVVKKYSSISLSPHCQLASPEARPTDIFMKEI